MPSIEDLATRLSQALPPQVGPIRDELHANFRAILQSQLARLDLVPREEFEAAREMLAHSRRKLDAMEQRLAALEAERKA
ncbi:accessory factor UbiK family protein [Salinisphaera aquimarina]|uniref:Ubiquinone biosynthesis accessory factor UbiK n=1 Tax=Salinisphaera aquimarina TaxID=2094031 RepID=A0ABV7ENV9_9GAMM